MFSLAFYAFFVLQFVPNQAAQRPNVIFIIADDLGWNDVGFHGSGQIPTPNIDALAYSGVILNNYYVTPICTPSRSALMTGKYPIHTGMQHAVLYGAEPRGLPLQEKLLPEFLRELGYKNHIVGKWHLGSYKKEYTPLYRGFDSHLGYWTGHQDYFDHTAVERPSWGLDMRRGLDLAKDLHGQYSTDLFTKEAVRLIHAHNSTEAPMFLYVAHAAVHSANPYNPLPAPAEVIDRFSNIQDGNRRRFAGMLSKLDESVGEIVGALRSKGMLKDSIIVFTTDNGGPAAGFNLNAASNFPLRGVKNTLWEGGVRGAGLVWGKALKKAGRVASQRMHITDWLPSLLSAVGGDYSFNETPIDGVDIWENLSENSDSKRTEILYNIDDIYGNAAVSVGPWKLITGTTYNGQWDGWFGPSGHEVPYNISLVQNSAAGAALAAIGQKLNPKKILELREEATISCPNSMLKTVCKPLQAPCLFNVRLDPCEQRNVADVYPKILEDLKSVLKKYNSTAVPPGNLPLDPKGDPKLYDYVWTNFGDL